MFLVHDLQVEGLREEAIITVLFLGASAPPPPHTSQESTTCCCITPISKRTSNANPANYQRIRISRNRTGAVLAHIKDLTISHAHEKDGIGNSAYTTDKQVFYTEVGNHIVLMALEIGQDGGMLRISSGARVYNELAATRHPVYQQFRFIACSRCVQR